MDAQRPLPKVLKYLASTAQSLARSWVEDKRRRGWRGFINSTNLLRILWIYALWYNEVTTYRKHMEKCAWEKWEDWPAGASPARVALVADPQLVDPHTYDRSKLLMKPTIYYTDRYMAHSYQQLVEVLEPSHILFLGDLFDGGREWNTEDTNERSKSWGSGERAHANDVYWHKEYDRFSKIFPNHPGILTVKSLPGNHDLGFGKGVKPEVYERFRAFFGETNSVWEIGNHSFVLLDTVSLSDDRTDRDGWRVGGKAKEWLEEYTKGMHQPVPRIPLPRKLMPLQIQDATEKDATDETVPPPQQSMFDHRLPAILLTHVPLYRAPNTECGPLRESKNYGGGIPIHAGYQYSNVLTHELSRELLQRVSPQFVFSGDDHDYCVTEHAGVGDPGKGMLRTGRWGLVKEITVKSFSWAMGVRRPGFLQVSLWNPEEQDGGGEALAKFALKAKNKQRELETEIGTTIQTHLCLQPDQYGIFIIYSSVFGFCLLLVLAKNIYMFFSGGYSPSSSAGGPSLYINSDKANFGAHKEPLLPLSTPTPTHTHFNGTQIPISTTSATLAPNGVQKTRPATSSTTNSNSRTSSPRPGGYAYQSGKTTELETPIADISIHDDDSGKYHKAVDSNGGINNWIASSLPTDAAEKLFSPSTQKFVKEKKFAAQKMLQSSKIGRQIVKGWRATGKKVRKSPVGRSCSGLFSILNGTFWGLARVALVVIPLYFYILGC